MEWHCEICDSRAIDHDGKHRTLKLEELGDWSLLGGHLSDQLDVDVRLEDTVDNPPS